MDRFAALRSRFGQCFSRAARAGCSAAIVYASNGKARSLLFAAALISANALAGEEGFLIDVSIWGAEAGKGQVIVSLFDSAETFLEAPLLTVKENVDRQGQALVSFGAQPPGEYAIAVIYDENNNDRLDTGLFRIPKEKIGFSNDARARFGPPKWDDAWFHLADADVSIEIQLSQARQ